MKPNILPLVIVICVLSSVIIVQPSRIVRIPVMTSSSSKSDHLRASIQELKDQLESEVPGLDVAYPSSPSKLTEYPMPHLYSGNLHAHEDGEAFIKREDGNADSASVFDFEKEAVKTKKFIPYTYVIELSETVESEGIPQGSATSLDVAHTVPHNSISAAYWIPRLKSEEVKKKVEVFIEKGYDRGAYDHKGFEDHNSKWNKYKEVEKEKYGGSVSSKTRENEVFGIIDPEDEPIYNNLERSGSSVKPSKLFVRKGRTMSLFQNDENISKSRDKERNNKNIVIIRRPNPRMKKPLKRKNVPNGQSKNQRKKTKRPLPKNILNIYSTNAKPKRIKTHSKKSFDDLFSIPKHSSFYSNLKSKHTVPSFSLPNEFNVDYANRPSSSRVIPQFSPVHHVEEASSHKLRDTHTVKQLTPLLPKDTGAPDALLKKEPCLSPLPLTANFRFGEFKPELGEPEWYKKDAQVLEPLKGQVDILREEVYAPVLKEALCL